MMEDTMFVKIGMIFVTPLVGLAVYDTIINNNPLWTLLFVGLWITLFIQTKKVIKEAKKK